ncbi:MAG: hypothetical protein O2800_01665 [Planctomycetota bacterium]|nr:hypothetical protein [Planctomycetota bacterium]
MFHPSSIANAVLLVALVGSVNGQSSVPVLESMGSAGCDGDVALAHRLNTAQVSIDSDLSLADLVTRVSTSTGVPAHIDWDSILTSPFRDRERVLPTQGVRGSALSVLDTAIESRAGGSVAVIIVNGRIEVVDAADDVPPCTRVYPGGERAQSILESILLQLEDEDVRHAQSVSLATTEQGLIFITAPARTHARVESLAQSCRMANGATYRVALTVSGADGSPILSPQLVVNDGESATLSVSGSTEHRSTLRVTRDASNGWLLLHYEVTHGAITVSGSTTLPLRGGTCTMSLDPTNNIAISVEIANDEEKA